MYFGEVQTVLDEKHRITVPSRFRKTMDVLGHYQWFMARGYDGCIFIFPRQEWDRIREEMGTYSALDARAVELRRMLFGSVAEVSPDRQGRMPVPEHLRQLASLDREAVLLGVEDHLELWNRSAWRDYQRRREPEFKEMASSFFTNGTGTGERPEGPLAEEAPEGDGPNDAGH